MMVRYFLFTGGWPRFLRPGKGDHPIVCRSWWGDVIRTGHVRLRLASRKALNSLQALVRRERAGAAILTFTRNDTPGTLNLILREPNMAKINLAAMSVEALLQLRDDVGRVLERKAGELQHHLAALGADVGGRGGRGRRSSLKGMKVAPKYRNPKNRSETWAGRGAMPRWMAAEIKAGKKREDFLIQKPAAKARKKK
jgi:DNA-binding protein H-NS